LLSQNNKNALSRAFPFKTRRKIRDSWNAALREMWVKIRASPISQSRQLDPESTIFSVIHNIVARIHRVSTGESTFSLVVYFHFDNVSKVCSPWNVSPSSEI